MGPDPDPLVRGTDPRIMIRNKLSGIPNTVVNNNISGYRESTYGTPIKGIFKTLRLF
jgi:hypothetical protein